MPPPVLAPSFSRLVTSKAVRLPATAVARLAMFWTSALGLCICCGLGGGGLRRSLLRVSSSTGERTNSIACVSSNSTTRTLSLEIMLSINKYNPKLISMAPKISPTNLTAPAPDPPLLPQAQPCSPQQDAPDLSLQPLCLYANFDQTV